MNKINTSQSKRIFDVFFPPHFILCCGACLVLLLWLHLCVHACPLHSRQLCARCVLLCAFMVKLQCAE